MRGNKEMKIKYEIDTEEINKNFTEGQIKAYIKEYGISYIEAVAYLYFYNYAHVRLDDFKKNFGRQMFVKHAKVLPQFLKKCEEVNK